MALFRSIFWRAVNIQTRHIRAYLWAFLETSRKATPLSLKVFHHGENFGQAGLNFFLGVAFHAESRNIGGSDAPAIHFGVVGVFDFDWHCQTKIVC